jgi:FAD/FMN-containing dehydrogenase/Fe-S oxidoreductase
LRDNASGIIEAVSTNLINVNAPLIANRPKTRVAPHSLISKLRANVDGEVLFDTFSRGRYSTDASIYQIEPVGVVVPRNEEAACAAIQIAAEQGIPILARGAGTSQCGQTVGAALVIDCSKYLNQVVELDVPGRRVTVQPGVVLDHLNKVLLPHGLWFPVDVSTSAQATLGGMAGNNSCGARSIRYGNMVHNVAAIDAWLPGGESFRFGPASEAPEAAPAYRALVERIQAVVEREADEITKRWPTVLRHVQGYNLDMLRPDHDYNLSHLLVGSEGTLAFSRRLTLQLSPLPASKVLGVVQFPSFYRAMECTQQIVALDPDAVELIDRTMIDLASENPAFESTVRQFIRGEPQSVLLVEFAGDNRKDQLARLKQLVELMADLKHEVVEITDAGLQKAVWEVRKAGLNIMMSMKGDGKPVSFVEDCAVPLEHLAEYTDRLSSIFEKHGTRGTWYAHASVGTLHVRPVLDMRRDGAEKMRAIAEEACAMVKEYKGAFSGEHGDGLVRSEWIEPIIGSRLTAALGEIKHIFDPNDVMNPGKIVRPTRMDDPSLFRYKPGYHVDQIDTALDWSDWGGLGPAVEMCNNNGHCRKFDAGTMCPSYRVTRDEKHLTRGRANTLRLALSGQLDADAFTSQELYDTMALCVGCKGCKRECPTGIDMARMKTEFLHHYGRRHGVSLRQRLIAWLPRYAPGVSRFASAANFLAALPGVPFVLEKVLGFSRSRSLPRWSTHAVSSPSDSSGTEHQQTANQHQVHQQEADQNKAHRREVVLLADTFNRWFEPENINAAIDVLEAAGYTVRLGAGPDGERPLCCGRTFLASGLVEQARHEARRTIEALRPYVERGCPVIGLEPSCLLTLRDEYLVLGLGEDAKNLARQSYLFEEFVAAEARAGNFDVTFKSIPQRALLHGHCHQKAFDAMAATNEVLSLVPDLKVETIQSGCCGMAGSFGYEKEHYDVSMKMAEASLLPAVRKAQDDEMLIADGTSCRQQINHGSGRKAVHVARVLQTALQANRA